MADTLEKLSRGDPTRRSWQDRFLGKWPKLTAMMYQTETELGQERVRSLEDLEKKLTSHTTHNWTGPDQEMWSSGSRTTDHVMYDEERSSALTGSQKGRGWNKCTTIVCVFLVLSIIAAVIAGIGLAILLLKPFHGLEPDSHTHGDDHIDAYLGPTEEEYLTKKFCNLVKALLQGVEFPTDNGLHSCYSTLKLVKGSENIHIELHVVPTHGYTVKEKLRRALRDQVLMDGMYRLNDGGFTRYLQTDGSIFDGEFPLRDSSLLQDQLAVGSTGVSTTTKPLPTNDRVNAFSSGIITINRTSPYVNNTEGDTGFRGGITNTSTTLGPPIDVDEKTKTYGNRSSINNKTLHKPSSTTNSVTENNTLIETTTAILLTQTEQPFPPPIPTVTEQFADALISVTNGTSSLPIPTPPGPTFDTPTPRTGNQLHPSTPTTMPNRTPKPTERTATQSPSPSWARSELNMRLPHPLSTMPKSLSSSSYGYFTQPVYPTKDSALPVNNTVAVPSSKLLPRHNALTMSDDTTFEASVRTIQQMSESTNKTILNGHESVVAKASKDATVSKVTSTSLPPIFPVKASSANIRPVPIKLFGTGVEQGPSNAIEPDVPAEDVKKRKSKEPFVAESLMSHGVIKLPFKTTSKFRFLFSNQNSDTNDAKANPDGTNLSVPDLRKIKVYSRNTLYPKGNDTVLNRNMKTLPLSQTGPAKTRTELRSPLTKPKMQILKGMQINIPSNKGRKKLIKLNDPNDKQSSFALKMT